MDYESRIISVMEPLMCVVKFEDVSACLRLTNCLDLNDLTSFIIKRWPELKSRMYLGYSIPKITSFCELNSVDDYMNMLEMSRLHSMKQIEVTIYRNVGESARSKGVVAFASSENMSVSASGASTEVTSSVSAPHDVIERSAPVLMTYRWRNCITGVNQLFSGGAEEFRLALNKYSLYKKFMYYYKKNHSRKVVAYCNFRESLGCEWKIHACGDASTSIFYTKKYNPDHTCGSESISRTITRAHSDIVAEIVEEKMRTKPLYRAIDCKSDFQSEYGLDISYGNAWAGIEKARSNLYGEYKYSFHQLWLYCEAVKASNPGSHVVFEVDSTNRFQRLFLSFKACIEGFNYCRPTLYLDSTFLTGRYRGQMFAATAKDANNNLYPVAYAVVDSENKVNWEWFMRQLHIILRPERTVIFISDRNEGLLHAVSTVFPNSPHGYCTVHLKMNMKVLMGKIPAEAKEAIFKLFDEVIYARTYDYYIKKMEQLRKVCGNGINDMLDKIDPIHYVDYFFPGPRYGETSSNAAESFNKKFKEERQLPLYGLIDGIRLRIMKDITAKKEAAAKWKTPLCPVIDKIMTDRMHLGSTWLAVKASDTLYEVMAQKSVKVNLEWRTCTCVAWQVSCLHCAHALSAILRSKRPLIDFIDPYYLTSTYRSTYEINILPLPTLDIPRVDPSACTIWPPLCKPQPGRRKNKRIRSMENQLCQREKYIVRNARKLVIIVRDVVKRVRSCIWQDVCLTCHF